MADGFLADEEPAISVVGGRYIIGKKLGQGSFGSVYQAQDLKNHHRMVAVKTLDFAEVPQHLSENSWQSWPVMREVNLLRSLEAHPNICSVLDFVQGKHRRFHLVMEMCVGPNLQYVLRKRGALELAEAANILRQCVSALAHLHERKIIHRDVKPSNIVFRDEVPNACTSPLQECTVQLVDFGLARLVPERCHSPLTRRTTSKEGSTHGGSECSGGSKEGSKHGGATFECSAHGSKLFAPPEFQEAWEASQSKILLTSAAAALIDVYSLGLVLEYMVLGARRDQLAAAREAAAHGGGGSGAGDGGGGRMGRLRDLMRRASMLLARLLFKPAPPLRTRHLPDLPHDLAQLIGRMTGGVFERATLGDVAAHPWMRDDGASAAGGADDDRRERCQSWKRRGRWRRPRTPRRCNCNINSSESEQDRGVWCLTGAES